MLKHKTLLFIAIILLVPLVSSLDDTQISLSAQQNFAYDLKVPCSLNGYYCNPTTLCNLSIIDLNSSYLINNKAMNLNGQFVNYTLSNSQTRTLGKDIFVVTCYDPFVGLNDSTQGFLYITPSGKLITSGEDWILLAAVLLVLILGVIFMLMALFLPPSPVKLFLFVLGLLMIIGSLMLSVNVIQNYVTNNSTFSKAMEYLFILLGFLGFATFILLLVFTVIKVLKFLKNTGRMVND